MPFEVKREENKNIIVATYRNSISYDDRINVVETVKSFLSETPTLGVLIDTSQAEDCLTNEEHVQFGKYLAENRGFYTETRVAVLVKHQADQAPTITIAYIRGFKNMVEFTNKNEAIQWLNGEFS